MKITKKKKTYYFSLFWKTENFLINKPVDFDAEVLGKTEKKKTSKDDLNFIHFDTIIFIFDIKMYKIINNK